MPRLPVVEGQLGVEVPDSNLFATMAVRPQIAAASAEQLRVVMRTGSVPGATKTLCAAMVSAVNYCEPALIA